MLVLRREARANRTKLDAQERELKRLHRQTRLYRDVSEGVVSTDLSLTICSWNRGAQELFGWTQEEAIGSNLSVLLEPERDSDSTPLFADLRKHGHLSATTHLRGKKGQLIDVSITATMLCDSTGSPYVIAVIEDITKLKQLERELQHAKKMEEVGRLSAGIAHDFNNLLVGIIGCADLATSQVETNSEAATLILQIKQAARSGSAITRQLLRSSRKQDDEPTLLELGEQVLRVEPMLRAFLGAEVAFRFRREAEAIWFLASEGQILRILMNLVANARDAMPTGGTLTLTVGAEELLDHPHLKPGPYVSLTAQDTGVGMDATVRSRLFDAFFTTKHAAKGTGLGLSTVSSIVGQRGGSIEVRSQPGNGSTFLVLLPRSPGPKRAQPPASLPFKTLGAGRTALVVDDEPLVRLSICHYLESWGFKVMSVQDGSEISELGHDVQQIDLLVTDIVLPGQSCVEVVSQLTRANNKLRVIHMSAHPREFLLETHRLQQEQFLLQKPFSDEEFLAIVSEVLRRPPLTET